MGRKEIQELINDGVGFSQEKHLFAQSLSEITSAIPEKTLLANKDFIRTYFRAQLHIARGQRTKASAILRGLEKRTGFLKFEEQNESLLAAVDIAVRGSSNRQDFKGEPIEPLFRLDK